MRERRLIERGHRRVLGPKSAHGHPCEQSAAECVAVAECIWRKRIVPKIGATRINQRDLLPLVYTRGAWNATPDHHLLFPYQAVPAFAPSIRAIVSTVACA